MSTESNIPMDALDQLADKETGGEDYTFCEYMSNAKREESLVELLETGSVTLIMDGRKIEVSITAKFSDWNLLEQS